MALKFVAASSQNLRADRAPAITIPFTFAIWAIPTFSVGGNSCAFSIDSTADFSRVSIGNDGTPEWWIQASNGAGAVDEADVVSVTAGEEFLLIARIISTTSRRLAVLRKDGSVGVAQGTNTATNTGFNQVTIGDYGSFVGGAPFDGVLGKAWIADADIWGADTDMEPWFVRMLGRDGPFGMHQQLADSIVWYMDGADQLLNDEPEMYVRTGPRPVWTNSNGVTLAPDIQASTLADDPEDSAAVVIV